MARPKKCRRVCHFPQALVFEPMGDLNNNEAIVLTVDQYETIRLIDKEGLSQEQCGEQMGIARTTVQLIYTTARKLLADALVEGRTIRIEGGDYEICSGDAPYVSCSSCFKPDLNKRYFKPKGDNIMRIAVTFEDGNIFQHFGHTEQFKIYNIEDGKIISSEVVGTNGSGHGALADILKALDVDILICGGIGGGAQAALANAGIRFYGGVSGNADAAVNALLADSLNYDPNARCDHHDHGDHECGSHHEHTCQGHCHH